MLHDAVRTIAPGRYAVGVSGGADSVALLHLLHHHRPDLLLHVVHLDHQTRGQESAADAEFVRQLAMEWGLAHTIARRSEVEPLLRHPPANKSALFRALRLELCRRVAAAHQLDAVLLAHHADDQAETVLHRLLRGSSVAGLAGIAAEARQRDLQILRPLLEVEGRALRDYLRAVGQPWREDASNRSDQYARNRNRRVLADHPAIAQDLRALGRSCAALRQWVRWAAPKLPEVFEMALLGDLPGLLAQESARQWLVARGVPADELLPSVAQRLIDMATDAASPARQHFPGRVLVRRRGGRIFVERA